MKNMIKSICDAMKARLWPVHPPEQVESVKIHTRDMGGGVVEEFPSYLARVENTGVVSIHRPEGFEMSGTGVNDGTHVSQVKESLSEWHGRSIANYLLDAVQYDFDDDYFSWSIEFMVYKRVEYPSGVSE